MAEQNYEDGVREGQISTIKATQLRHETRLDSHSKRLRTMERIIWLIVGGLIVLQALPVIQDVMKTVGN